MKHKNIIKSSAQYTRSYENMRGMSLTVSGGDTQQRYGYLENMYVDYEGGGEAVESIPGFRRLVSLGGRIHGIYSQKLGEGAEFITVHAGRSLYRFNKDMRDSLDTHPPKRLAELADVQSHAFSYGRELYVMDGEKLVKISEDGEAVSLGAPGALPYVPTTYINGEKNEPRNLLTDEFTETWSVSSTDVLSYGTKSLSYAILDSAKRTCAVTGSTAVLEGELHIPSYTDIGGERYAVVRIAEWAFRFQTKITALITNPGLLEIERYAFWGCTGIKSAIVSDTVETLGEYAFYSCSSMEELYFSRALKRIDASALSLCQALKVISYGGDENHLAKLSGREELGDREISYYSTYRRVKLAIPLHSASPTVLEVTVGGEPKDFYLDSESSELIIDCADRTLAEGRVVRVRALFGDGDRDGPLLSKLGTLLPREAVLGCRVSAVFDGRIFLSGHPRLYGAVLYSSADNPLYFPVSCCLNDGDGGYPVVSLLPAHGSLAVFKSGDDGSGSIFYHTPRKDTAGGTEYPVSYIHGGVSAYGAAYTFFDDALFLSQVGVSALEPVSGSDYREIKSRSENISPMLSSEAADKIKMCGWGGYLVLMAGGRFYLGDSRDKFSRGGSFEYEWYLLNGIGTYKNDSRVYRYATVAKEGYSLSDTPDGRVYGEIMSLSDGTGGLIYYVTESDKRVLVYPTEEYTGGEFSPASAVLGGELLFFGTESGDLCLFNSDKRGVPPERIRLSADFDAAEYGRTMGKRIHPDFYSFASHAPRYALKTKSDACDLPYLTKSTVRGSLTVKCKSYLRSLVTCEVGTEKDGFSAQLEFPGGRFSFAELDFSALASSAADYATVPVPEAKRGWIEKVISLYSEQFCSPIGVYSINYRYKVKGKIK